MATITKTIGTDSRDYSTMTAWEADLDDVSIYSASDDAVGEVYPDSVYDESLTINGGSTVGLNSIKLTVPVSEKHNGKASSGPRIVNSTITIGFIILMDSSVDTTVEWLEVTSSSSFSDSAMCGGISGGTTAGDHAYQRNVRNCIVHDLIASSGDLNGLHFGGSDSALLNNLVYDIVNNQTGSDDCTGIYAYKAGLTSLVECYNNTAYLVTNNGGTGRAWGIYFGTGTGGAEKNNISMGTGGTTSGNKNDFDGTTANSDYNMSEDSTAAGANSLTGKTISSQFVNTADGSEDLHLLAGSDALEAGVDLGTTPANVNIDIDGRNRDYLATTVWDIGADQKSGGAAAKIQFRLGAMVCQDLGAFSLTTIPS